MLTSKRVGDAEIFESSPGVGPDDKRGAAGAHTVGRLED